MYRVYINAFMILLLSPPHFALQKYISQYAYISFNSSELPSLKQTFLPFDIPNLAFYVGPVSLELPNNKAQAPVLTSFSQVTPHYIGLVTSPLSVHFGADQQIKTFIIAFKPAGFSSLFNTDAAELTDKIPDFSLLCSASDATRFCYQVLSSNNFQSHIKIFDDFFLKRISICPPQMLQIKEACRRIILSNGLECMTDLAYHTNMSLRNLERQFMELVGVPPKKFARFKRLHRALLLINSHSQPPWSAIATECGYYDQAHFINEFKLLTGNTPSFFATPRPEYMLYNLFILYAKFPSY